MQRIAAKKNIKISEITKVEKWKKIIKSTKSKSTIMQEFTNQKQKL